MKKENSACEQVASILSLYISGNTPYQISTYIMEHLKKCKSCREKYERLAKNMINLNINPQFVANPVEETPKIVQPVLTFSFREKMSAYIDSELSDEENVRFKKHVIANKPMRNELEDLYKVKNAINLSIKRTKHNFNNDYSKKVLTKLELKEHVFKSESILKITSIFIFLFTFFSVGVIVLYQILM